MSALVSLDSVVLAATILLLFASWKLYERRRAFRHITSKMPTEFGLPFIGMAYKFFNFNKLFENVSRGFDEIQSLTGCLWVVTTPIIVTVEPEVIKHVTSSPEFLNKSRDLYAHFHNGVINGIIVKPGEAGNMPLEKWKPDRKAISPFVSHNNLLSLMQLFNNNANKVKQKLTGMTDRGEQDVYTVINAFGLQLSISTVMGIKMEEGTEEYNEVMDAFNATIHRMTQNALYSSVGLGFITKTPKYMKTLKYLRGLVRGLIKKNLGQQTESEEFDGGRQTLINLTLKALRKGQFDVEDVEIESFTMIAASFETTAIALFATLVMLAMHPDIQERAFQEILSVYPDGITSVEYDDLNKFPYLDMIIAETLRLAPSVPYIGRQAINETELRPGLTIPKEMQVIIPIYELHRRKEFWGPEPTRFNPDNFLPEKIAKRHPCAYLPFSKGARNCIGFRYADIAMKVVLITLLRSLKFSTTFKYDDIVFMPRVTLCFEVEPLLNIEIREN